MQTWSGYRTGLSHPASISRIENVLWVRGGATYYLCCLEVVL